VDLLINGESWKEGACRTREVGGGRERMASMSTNRSSVVVPAFAHYKSVGEPNLNYTRSPHAHRHVFAMH
jgi:hypothetical protein